MVTLIFAFMVLLLSSLLLNATVKHSSQCSWILGLYTIIVAQVVLVAELAGVLHFLNSQRCFLMLHLLLLGCAWLLWRRALRPSLVRSGAAWAVSPRYLFLQLRLCPALSLLALAVGLVYAVGAGLILTVPPNNGDGLETYLARVGFWLQHGSFESWPTENIWQVVYPPNAQLQVLWTVLFWGSDQLSGFVQWFSALASAVAIYGLARFFDSSRRAALFSALIWLGFTDVVLHSTTVQYDLAASALLLIGVFFLYTGHRSSERGPLLLSGVSFALALGTKITAAFCIPGLLVTILLLLIPDNRKNRRSVFFWASCTVIAFLALGALIYVCNILTFGHPLGPGVSSELAEVNRRSGVTGNPIVAKMGVAFYYFYRSFDLTGLPKHIADKVYVVFAAVGTWILPRLGVSPSLTSQLSSRPALAEDAAWFGPLSFLMLYPASFFVCWRALFSRDVYRLGLAVMAVLFIITFVCVVPPVGANSRYLVFAFSVCAPFMAIAFRPGLTLRVFRWAAVVLTIMVMFNTVLLNQMKPMIGPRSVFGKDRIDLQTINYPTLGPATRGFEKLIPQDATVGLVNFPKQYLLFGNHFTRKVVVVPADFMRNRAWLNAMGIEYLVVSLANMGTLQIPGFDLIGLYDEPYFGESRLYCRSGDGKFKCAESHLRRALLSEARFPSQKPLVWISDALNGDVGVASGLGTAGWGIESDSNHSFLWIGHGEAQGARMVVWSGGEYEVDMQILVHAGSAQSDSRRTLEVKVNNEKNRQQMAGFDESAILRFPLTLTEGRNEVSIFALDSPSRPNPGNSRPLVVLLDAIRIMPSDLEYRQAGPKKAPLITLDTSASARLLRLVPDLTVPWSVESSGNISWLWLGYGKREGLGFSVWSQAQRSVTLQIAAAAGPCRQDKVRNLQLEILREKVQTPLTPKTFSGEGTVQFEVLLAPGVNRFSLFCSDPPTRRNATDSRTLLAQINHIVVSSPIE